MYGVQVLELLVDMITSNVGWLRLVGSLKTHVSFAKEPYTRVV